MAVVRSKNLGSLETFCVINSCISSVKLPFLTLIFVSNARPPFALIVEPLGSIHSSACCPIVMVCQKADKSKNAKISRLDAWRTRFTDRPRKSPIFSFEQTLRRNLYLTVQKFTFGVPITQA